MKNKAGRDALAGDGRLIDFHEGKNETGEIIRVRLPQKRNGEMFGSNDLMMGANHIWVRCYDGVTRIGRIKGKIKKKVWIREGPGRRHPHHPPLELPGWEVRYYLPVYRAAGGVAPAK